MRRFSTQIIISSIWSKISSWLSRSSIMTTRNTTRRSWSRGRMIIPIPATGRTRTYIHLRITSSRLRTCWILQIFKMMILQIILWKNLLQGITTINDIGSIIILRPRINCSIRINNWRPKSANKMTTSYS